MSALGEQPIERAPEGISVAWQTDDVGWKLVDRVDGRLAVGDTHAANLAQTRPRRDAEIVGRILVGDGEPRGDDLLRRSNPAALEILGIAEIGVQPVPQGRPVRDERSGALSPNDIAILDEGAHGLAERDATHREAVAQLLLVGEFRAWRETSGYDLSSEFGTDDIGQQRASARALCGSRFFQSHDRGPFADTSPSSRSS